MADEPGVMDQAKETLTDSEETLGEKAPGTPFALVALSYLAALAAACIVTALFIWLIR